MAPGPGPVPPAWQPDAPLPWGAPAPRTASSRRKTFIWAGLAAGLALLLVAGVGFAIFASAGPSRETATKDLKAPFVEAVNSLRAAPGVQFDNGTYAVKLTRYGDFTGTMKTDYGEAPVMRTDGVIYAKLNDTAVSSVTHGFDATGSAWVKLTADSLEDLYADATPPDDPSDVGTLVLAALNDPDTDFSPAQSSSPGQSPAPSTPGWTEVTLYGTPAYEAKTPVGEVYVSQSSPHRLLQVSAELLSAEAAESLSGTPSSTTGQGVSYRSGADPISFWAQRAAGGPAVDIYDGVALTEMTVPEVDQAYDDLVKSTPALKNALQAGIDLKTGTPKIKCTLSACSYKISVTTQPYSTSSDTKVTGSTARVALTVKFEIDGKKDAGRCTAVGTFRMEQTKTLDCSTTSTSAAAKTAMAAAHASALATSRARGGGWVSYSVPYNGYGYLKGIAHLDTSKMVSALQDRKSRLDASVK